MLTLLVTSFAALVWLAVWVGPAYADVFSSTGPVIAILAGDLFVGEAEGHLDGAGTMRIHSRAEPDVTCSGQFTSSAALGGKGNMQCSDGATASFQFKRLTLIRGYGTGNSTRGSMSFTYGLSAIDSAPYLNLPVGKGFWRDGKDLELVDLR